MSIIRIDTEVQKLKEQVADLTKRLDALEAKKKPGRPPKNA